MFSFLAAAMAVRSRGLESGSPPPTRAAMVISRISLVKMRPRLASVAAFLCLIVAHLECPDISRLALSLEKLPRSRPSGDDVRNRCPDCCLVSLAHPLFRGYVHDSGLLQILPVLEIGRASCRERV